MLRIGGERLPIPLVRGEAREVDERKRGVGGTGELRRRVVADHLTATALDRRGDGARIGLEVGELVRVQCVANAQRDHWRPPLVCDLSRRSIARAGQGSTPNASMGTKPSRLVSLRSTVYAGGQCVTPTCWRTWPGSSANPRGRASSPRCSAAVRSRGRSW